MCACEKKNISQSKDGLGLVWFGGLVQVSEDIYTPATLANISGDSITPTTNMG